jgi:Tfp pilus assembly protein FimV
MHGQSTNHGVFGLMVLGLVATTLMFLTFAMAGMNFLDDAADKAKAERAIAAQIEEQRLLELRQRIAQLQAEQQGAQDRHLASERDVAQLQERLRAETEPAVQLKRDLADASKIPVGHIYGAARGVKSVQYVECVDGAAILQSQGKRLAPSDTQSLSRALVPGHVALLVRPGGFDTFLAVRAALSQRLDLQLGYLPVERG